MTIGSFLQGLFGPAPPREKSEDELRWEDDGGPTHVACEGYEHVLAPVDDYQQLAIRETARRLVREQCAGFSARDADGNWIDPFTLLPPEARRLADAYGLRADPDPYSVDPAQMGLTERMRWIYGLPR